MIKNRQKLLEYAGKDLSGKEFINRCIGEENGFYRGRSELFDKIVEILCKEENLERMISLYSALKSDGEIELINRYFREYARYSTTEWDFDAEKVLEKRFTDPNYCKIAAFCERSNMSELHGYLCTWFFEENDRYALLNIFLRNS